MHLLIIQHLEYNFDILLVMSFNSVSSLARVGRSAAENDCYLSHYYIASYYIIISYNIIITHYGIKVKLLQSKVFAPSA